MRKYNGEEIYRAIPNRYRQMILDTLIVDEGEKASGYVKLSPGDWFFQCHFPGMPVLPATLLVETMTQVFISTFLKERAESTSVACDWKPKNTQLFFPNDAYLRSFRRGIARGNCKAFQLADDLIEKETLVTEFEVSHALPSLMAVPHLGGKT